ncbi:hypothetical protein [Pedobacter frigoris]|uniref:hypothetical protein n=1 Tax=Pedobacter frigoris TaxID=2571272 RepID=UPI00293068BF|nr:hypothetical protein [Pedobacter frigoris]
MKTCSLFISIKDVEELANVSPSTAQRKLQFVRKHFNIAPYGEVTMREYCACFRLDIADVQWRLKGNDALELLSNVVK